MKGRSVALKRAHRTRGGRNSLPHKLDWIRSLSCAVCGCGPCEAHHIRIRGSRATDERVIPLCALSHHRDGPLSYHVLGRREFERVHGLNVTDLAALLHEVWREGIGAL